MPARPEHLRWLKANKHHLGALTGTDFRALAAIDACWQLYPHADEPAQVLAAVRLLLTQMQDKTHYLARELIARSMDWGDRDRLWPLITDAVAAHEEELAVDECPHGVVIDEGSTADMSCAQCHVIAGLG